MHEWSVLKLLLQQALPMDQHHKSFKLLQNTAESLSATRPSLCLLLKYSFFSHPSAEFAREPYLADPHVTTNPSPRMAAKATHRTTVSLESPALGIAPGHDGSVARMAAKALLDSLMYIIQLTPSRTALPTAVTIAPGPNRSITKTSKLTCTNLDPQHSREPISHNSATPTTPGLRGSIANTGSIAQAKHCILCTVFC